MKNLQPAFIQNLGAQELILIFLIVLLLFGAKRMPELFRSFGKSLKEFKKATSDAQEDIRTAMDVENESPERSQKTQTKEVQPTATLDKKEAEENAKDNS